MNGPPVIWCGPPRSRTRTVCRANHPDKAGEWTLEAREAENHTARLTLTVDAADLAPTALIARHWAFVLLASLAFNIWLASMLLKYRRATR